MGTALTTAPRHCRKPRKALLSAAVWLVKVTSKRRPRQRLCGTRAAHAGGKLALKNKTRNESPGRQVSPCYFPHLPDCHAAGIRGGHVPPCKFLVANSIRKCWRRRLDVLQCDQPVWQRGCSKPSSRRNDVLLPAPGQVTLSCASEPVSKLALFLQAVCQPSARQDSLGAPPKLTRKAMEWI